MFSFDVCTSGRPMPEFGQNANRLIRLFGISRSRLKESPQQHLRFDVRPGEIVYITGASGAGKSVLLDAIYRQAAKDQRLRLEDIKLDDDKSVIDCMSTTAGMERGHPVCAGKTEMANEQRSLRLCLEALNKAGLSDVFAMLQSPKRLSEGQQARFRLAKALACHRPIIFADEFTSSMDRITASVISHHVRKTASRTNKIFILASCHDDILAELKPNVLIMKHSGGRTETIYNRKVKNF